MTRTLKKHSTDIFFFLILLGASVKFVYRLEYIIDVKLYDETSYLIRGVSIPEFGIPNASIAPLYALWYYLLSLFQPDRIQLYHLNYKILAVVPVLLLYLLLRSGKVSRLVALLVSFFFLISDVNLLGWPRVTHLALVMVLLSFILARNTKEFTSSILWVALGALFSSYIRPEYFLAYLLLLLLYGFIVLFRRHSIIIKNEGIKFWLVILLSVSLISLLGIPIGAESNRSFVAFGQHFALNWVKWTGSELSGWTDWELIIQQNFGDVNSTSSALISNPTLFAKHVAYNALGTGRELLRWFLFHPALIFPDGKYFDRLEALLLLIVPFFMIWSTRSQWLVRLRENYQAYKEFLLLCTCYFIPVLISTLVVFPEDHYLILLGLLLIIIISFAVATHDESKEAYSNYSNKQLLLLGLIIIAITPYHSYKHPIPKPTIETIRLIKQFQIKESVRLLEADGGYNHYIGTNFSRVAEHSKKTTFNDFMTSNGINMIVASTRLKKDIRFKDDPQWLSFLNEPSLLGYQKVPIPNTNNSVYIHQSLLAQ